MKEKNHSNFAGYFPVEAKILTDPTSIENNLFNASKNPKINHRLRRLVELKMLCNLSQELQANNTNEELLDHLAIQALEVTNAAVSRILTSEPDGSFMCQTVCHKPSCKFLHPCKKLQTAPIAAWLHYMQALNSKVPHILHRSDSILEDEQEALGLDQLEELWMMPLWAGAEKIGIFILGFENPSAPDELYNRIGLMTNIIDQATIRIQRKMINQNLEKSFIDIILALAENIEADSPSNNHHEHQTAAIMVAFSKYLNLSQKDTQTMEWAGLLHDIGKIQIPDELLMKPGPLTDIEWEVMKQHPKIGADLLSPVSMLHDALPIIEAHHEKFDGTGYPEGLRGEEIPIGARILAVADAYSVMVGGRIYRQPLSQPEAIYELKRCSGSHFDPFVINSFMELLKQGLIE